MKNPFYVLLFLAALSCNARDNIFFTFAPSGLFVNDYYDVNPSTGDVVNQWVSTWGIDTRFAWTIQKKHTPFISSAIGFGGLTGVLPIGYINVATGYQYGNKLDGFAAGPLFVFTDPAFGIAASYKRIDLSLFGYPKQVVGCQLGYAFGRYRTHYAEQ